MKQYLTWKRKKINEYRYIDINTDNLFNSVTNNSTFTETPYQIADGRFISFVEYPSDTTQEQIDTLITEYSTFEFTFITEIEANTLLTELGEVSVDNFIFTDNRPSDLPI